MYEIGYNCAMEQVPEILEQIKNLKEGK